MSQDNTVAITICGDSESLDHFIAALKETRWLSQSSIERYFTKLTKDNLVYYYCLLEDTNWDDIHQIECKALCKIASTYELSYYVCRLDTRDKKRFECSNAGKDYYKWRVESLFRVDKQYHFIDNRYKTLKEWMFANFELNTLHDICNHGCQGGFSGLTYYSETSALYDRYYDDIWEMLYDDSESLGNKNIIEMVGEFGGAKNVGGDEQFKNLLIWYAVEKIAWEICDENPDDKSDDEADEDEE